MKNKQNGKSNFSLIETDIRIVLSDFSSHCSLTRHIESIFCGIIMSYYYPHGTYYFLPV